MEFSIPTFLGSAVVSTVLSTLLSAFLSSRQINKQISNNTHVNKYNICVGYIAQIDTEFIKKIMLIKRLNNEGKEQSEDLHMIDLSIAVIYRKLNSEISSIKKQSEALQRYNSEYRKAIAPADQFHSSIVPSLDDFNKHHYDDTITNLQQEIGNLLGVSL